MSNHNTVFEVKQKYELGERQFNKMELRRADLRKVDLSHASLIGADLSYANLREANLSYCDLSNAYLNEADLMRANLKGANLTGASLIKTCLIKTNLEAANLTKAYLTEAYLTQANLTKAYLTGTYLNGAKLNSANLTGSYYNDQTNFDVFFDPIKVAMNKVYSHEIPLEEVNITVEELLNSFNYLSQCGSYYLGNAMTVRNWNSSRPDFDWLNQFKINELACITFSGRLKDTVSTLQLEYSQQWIIDFVGVCSEVIPGFSSKINQQQLPFSIILLDLEEDDTDDQPSSIFGFLENS